MTAAAPSVVVTFLFTDVEGSTRRWEADADAMRGRWPPIMRCCARRLRLHGGFMFKRTNDRLPCPPFAGDAAVSHDRVPRGRPFRRSSGHADELPSRR
jgi:hypothetical protein